MIDIQASEKIRNMKCKGDGLKDFRVSISGLMIFVRAYA